MGRSKRFLYEFLNNLRDYIKTNNYLCELSLSPDDIRFPPGTPFILITPEAFTTVYGQGDGGGTEATVLGGRITLTVWVQVAVDPPQEDNTALTDTTLGVYLVVDEVLSLIQMYDPCDDSTEFLAEPFHLESVGKPVRDSKHEQYVKITIEMEAKIWQLI